jgi:magnesium-protoporphyrin IX monomethyl ester (oxidative) cyclase
MSTASRPLPLRLTPNTAESPAVVLVNPPGLAGRTNDRTLSGGIGVSRKLKPFERVSPAIPPIDLLYLAAVAGNAGALVAVLDLLVEPQDDAERRLDRIAADGGRLTWVGVRVSLPSLLEDLSFADRLKRRLPAARVFVFGPAIMATIDYWIADSGVDYVLYGEPEAFFADVLAADDPLTVQGVLSPHTYQPLTGEALMDERRNTERNARWIKAANMAALPRPAWHLLDLPRYAPDGRIGDIGVEVQASRGCPMACTMCPYMLIEGTLWRRSDADAVVDELEYLNRTFGIYRVRFRDANFGINRQYARALAEAVLARGVRLQATIETSIEVFDEETLRLLFRAGITTITTGVETNDAACMESIGHTLKVNTRLRERVQLCHQIGYHLYGTYCLGMPEETWQTVEKTWRFANDLDVESGFTVLTPFPGTPMYWRAIAEGLLSPTMRYSDWNSYTATVRTYALTTRDLQMARWWARMETILPYRRRRAAARGRSALARFYVRHVPHYAWRQVCRGYVRLRTWRAHDPSGPRSLQEAA